MDSLCNRIDIILSERNLTAVALAEKLGISSANISMWRSGKSKPSYQTAKQIGDVFGYRPEWILTGELPKSYLDPVSKETADILAHAISHNLTKKDTFLRAAASASDPAIDALEEFLIEFYAEYQLRLSADNKKPEP